MFRISIVLITFWFPFASKATEQLLPPQLQICFEQAVKEMLLVDRSDRTAIKSLFLRKIDQDRLGARAVGGAAWRNETPVWRNTALDLYFNLLYGKSSVLTEGMHDVNNTRISARLADHPIIKQKFGWHVVGNITIDNGNHFAIALLISPDCKAFDFSQGGWASSFVDAVDVDRAVNP